MPIKVGVIFGNKFRARRKVCPALIEGIRASNDLPIEKHAHEYRGIFSDVAMFYGFDGTRKSQLYNAFTDYRNAGLKAVYIDLGYFQANWNGDRYGYHRFSINDRHPTAYFQKVKHPRDRADAVGVVVEPWRPSGKHILVCGMSDKCATFEGFAFEQWERDAIAKIKSVTDRPIVYRPKPRRRIDPQYPRIAGVGYSDPSREHIGQAMKGAWAVVSHHSNAGVDALLAGVPCFTDEGVTLALGLSDLSRIETPRIPTDDERRQWANDIAYAQFNRPEMKNGKAWRHLKSEGLVP